MKFFLSFLFLIIKTCFALNKFLYPIDKQTSNGVTDMFEPKTLIYNLTQNLNTQILYFQM